MTTSEELNIFYNDIKEYGQQIKSQAHRLKKKKTIEDMKKRETILSILRNDDFHNVIKQYDQLISAHFSLESKQKLPKVSIEEINDEGEFLKYSISKNVVNFIGSIPELDESSKNSEHQHGKYIIIAMRAAKEFVERLAIAQIYDFFKVLHAIKPDYFFGTQSTLYLLVILYIFERKMKPFSEKVLKQLVQKRNLKFIIRPNDHLRIYDIFGFSVYYVRKEKSKNDSVQEEIEGNEIEHLAIQLQKQYDQQLEAENSLKRTSEIIDQRVEELESKLENVINEAQPNVSPEMIQEDYENFGKELQIYINAKREEQEIGQQIIENFKFLLSVDERPMVNANDPKLISSIMNIQDLYVKTRTTYYALELMAISILDEKLYENKELMVLLDRASRYPDIGRRILNVMSKRSIKKMKFFSFVNYIAFQIYTKMQKKEAGINQFIDLKISEVNESMFEILNEPLVSIEELVSEETYRENQLMKLDKIGVNTSEIADKLNMASEIFLQFFKQTENSVKTLEKRIGESREYFENGKNQIILRFAESFQSHANQVATIYANIETVINDQVNRMIKSNEEMGTKFDEFGQRILQMFENYEGVVSKINVMSENIEEIKKYGQQTGENVMELLNKSKNTDLKIDSMYDKLSSKMILDSQLLSGTENRLTTEIKNVKDAISSKVLSEKNMYTTLINEATGNLYNARESNKQMALEVGQTAASLLHGLGIVKTAQNSYKEFAETVLQEMERLLPERIQEKVQWIITSAFNNTEQERIKIMEMITQQLSEIEKLKEKQVGAYKEWNTYYEGVDKIYDDIIKKQHAIIQERTKYMGEQNQSIIEATASSKSFILTLNNAIKTIGELEKQIDVSKFREKVELFEETNKNLDTEVTKLIKLAQVLKNANVGEAVKALPLLMQKIADLLSYFKQTEIDIKSMFEEENKAKMKELSNLLDTSSVVGGENENNSELLKNISDRLSEIEKIIKDSHNPQAFKKKVQIFDDRSMHEKIASDSVPYFDHLFDPGVQRIDKRFMDNVLVVFLEFAFLLKKVTSEKFNFAAEIIKFFKESNVDRNLINIAESIIEESFQEENEAILKSIEAASRDLLGDHEDEEKRELRGRFKRMLDTRKSQINTGSLDEILNKKRKS